MRMLQAQIEPHFLFNTLANIQRPDQPLTRARQPDAGQLHRLCGKAFRQPLSGRHSQTEMELLRHYLNSSRSAWASGCSLGLRLIRRWRAAPLAPMLHNRWWRTQSKHGLETQKVEGGRVDVRIAREPTSQTAPGGQMRLTVRDNGLGFGEHADSCWHRRRAGQLARAPRRALRWSRHAPRCRRQPRHRNHDPGANVDGSAATPLWSLPPWPLPSR